MCEKGAIPFSNLQMRSYSSSSLSSSQRKSNQFNKNDGKSHTKTETNDGHPSRYRSHDDTERRSHSTNSYRQTRSHINKEPYIHYIPSTSKKEKNSNNCYPNSPPTRTRTSSPPTRTRTSPPTRTRTSTPVKLLSSELKISKTQNRLMALVLDRIEKLKQRITEVSPAEVY
jgi:anti-sigma28 factor (negative regulator of flagellin synthesis)